MKKFETRMMMLTVCLIATFFFCLPNLSYAQLTNGLVAYYSFDHLSDGAGLNPNAVLQGTANLSGGIHKLPFSLSTSGADLGDPASDHLTIPQTNALNFGSGSFSVAGWVRLNGHSTGAIIMGNSLSGVGWRISAASNGWWELEYNTNTQSPQKVGVFDHWARGGSNSSVWAFFAFCVNTTDGTVSGYTGQASLLSNGASNGAPTLYPVQSTTFTPGGSINTSSPFYLSPTFNASWDEFRIWNRVLTPAEVDQLYNNGNVMDPCVTPPISYLDSDNDGYGVSTLTSTACPKPSGYSYVLGDCNDNEPGVYKPATAVLSGSFSICNGAANLTITCTGTGPFSGTLSDGTAFNGASSPVTVSVSPTATTTYTITSFSDAYNASGCTATYSGSATVTITGAPPTTTGATINSPGIANLSASGTGTLNWYDAPTGSGLVNTGTTYSPSITNTSTYYVSNTVATSQNYTIGRTGAAAPAFSAAQSSSFGLVFDVIENCTLVSVQIVPMFTGGPPPPSQTGTIQLRNSSGTLLASSTFTVLATEGNTTKTVTLNFPLTPGTGYRLLKGSGSFSMRYEFGSTGTFPYPYSGAGSPVSIVQAISFGLTTNEYPYFYNWVVNKSSSCVSNRVPVTATLCTLPSTPTLMASSLNNCGTQNTTLNIASGSLNDATHWAWYSGSCGGTPVGSGTSINVSPSVSTSYYVRGEGGCVSNAACADVSINVTPSPVCEHGGTVNSSCGCDCLSGFSGTLCQNANYMYSGSGNWSSGSWLPAYPGDNINSGSSITILNGAICAQDLSSITCAGSFINNGTYKGTGAISGTTFINNGTLAPGNSPGCLTFGSGFVSSGTISIEVNGTTDDCTQFDKIIVSGGGADITGSTLHVSIGYTPTNNDQITFFDASASSLTGTFTTVHAPTGWAISYNAPSAGMITLTYTTPPANALDFDGANDYVETPFAPSIMGSTPTTIEFWAKAPLQGIGFPICINTADVAVRFHSNTHVQLEHYGGPVYDMGAVNDGCWHHYAFTSDGTTVYGFVDGLPASNPSQVVSFPATGAGNLFLGVYNYQYFFQGTLDEVRLWNVQRSQAQLQANMHHELTGSESGLLYYANFNQGIAGGINSGITTLFDQSTNYQTGSLNNFALNGSSSNWITSGALMYYPEINVNGNNVSIMDGDATPDIADHTGFGNVISGGNLVRTYTIQNTGSTDLNISSIVSSNSYFTIGSLTPSSPIATGNSATFTVTFSPAIGGLQNATITINNDDCNEGVYDFAVTGNGAEPNALNFNGYFDRVIAPNDNTYIFGSQSTTIEFWAKAAPIFSFPVDFSYDGLFVNWGPTLAFSVYGGDVYGTGYAIEDCWHHYAFTYNGSTGTMYGFVDGLPTPVPSYTGTFPTGLASLVLGGRLYDYGWNGTMDEVRLWNVQRTQAELQANMYTELAGNEAGLLAYYNFNQGSAGNSNPTETTLFDNQTNTTAHNGTLYSFALNGSTSNWITSGAMMYYPEINVQGNSIDIVDGSVSPSFNNHTDFAYVANGYTMTRTYTIQNSGSDALSVTSITALGGDAGMFSIGALSPASPVPAGGSATFTVTYTPTGTGIKSTTLQIASNDCDEAIYDFVVRGNTGPNIILDFGGIPNGAIGNYYNGGAGPNYGITFNPGDASNNGLSESSNPIVNFPAGFTTSFSVYGNVMIGFRIRIYDGLDGTGTLLADTDYVGAPGYVLSATFCGIGRSVSVARYSQPNAGYDDLTFGPAPVPVPEIDVQGGSPLVTITDGDITPSTTDGTDFGNVAVNGSLARTFTIFNMGNADLTISSITSSNGLFVVSGAPTSVATNSSATFTVTFSPTALGVQNATITINNNDCDEAVYDFAVTGKGATPASALSFDGVNDYVDNGSLNALDGATTFTIEAWAMRTTNTLPHPVIFSKSTGLGVATSINVGGWVPGNPGIYARISGANDAFGYNSTDNLLPLNTWAHVAVVYNGAGASNADRLKMYVNGNPVNLTYVGTIPATAPTVAANATTGIILGNAQRWQGPLDEMRIWNTARSCEEISQLRNCELTGSESGLVAYYNFNQGFANENNSSVTTLTDATSGNNNGTLNGFALNGATSNWVTPGGVVTGTNCPTVTAPEADVQGGSPLTSINDGDNSPSTIDHTDFENVTVNGSLARTFTIFNTGNADLTISSITSNNGLFVVSGAPTLVAANGSATFSVTFNPIALGVQNATITINNNDCDEAVYDFAVTGKGATPASALDFDGVNDYVDNGSLNALDGATTFTIEAWAMRTTNTLPHPVIFSKSTGLGVATSINVGGWVPGNPGIYARISGANDAFGYNSTDNLLPLNTWAHVAVVYNGAGASNADRLKMYVNGNPVNLTYVGTIPATAPTVAANATTGIILGNAQRWQGPLDEMRIWNTARTCDQINQLRNCELTGSESGLVAYYNFNQGFANENNSSVTTLTDATSGNNNGTLNGFALNGATSNWVTPGGVVTGTNCPTVTAPEADVQGGSPLTSINDGDNSPSTIDHTDFENVTVNGSLARTFTIFNTGNADLTISSITSNNGLFVVSGAPTLVAANGSATFSVTFNPIALGVQNATITINNNDCDEAVYDFAISGNGNCIATAFASCPANQTVNTTTTTCDNTVTYTAVASGIPAPTLTYAFTGATIASGSGTGSGSTFNNGLTNVVITASNGCGNNATCSFTVTVSDVTEPVITCSAPVTISNTPGLCTGTTTLTAPTVSDNCSVFGNSIALDGVDDYISASGAIGNVNTIEFWINPDLPINGSNASGMLFNFNGNANQWIATNGSASGISDETMNIGGVESGSTFSHLAIKNTISGWTHVAIVSNGTRYNTVYLNGVPVTTYTNPGLGNLLPPVYNINSLVIGKRFGGGYTGEFPGKLDEIRFWSSIRTQTEIQASMYSELNAQADLLFVNHFNEGIANANNAGITTTADASGNGVNGTLNNFALSGTSSNFSCGAFSGCVTNNAPTTYPVGSTTVTWTATDASGNANTCTQLVTVTDNQNPSITCPANISVNNDAGVCGAVVTFNAPIGIDNCPGASTSQTAGLPSGSTFPIGTTTQTFVVTDASGNTANCSFTVTVTDNQAPSITCPANISVNNDAGVCGAVVTFNAPIGSDNCPGASTSQTAGLPSGSTFPIGTTIQTFVVTDASGNTANCSFTVTVTDNQAPSITCPANISVNNDAGVCGAVVTFNAPIGIDNCPGASTSQTAGLPSGSTFPIGTTIQTFVVTDASGNTANCSFMVTVTDNQAPSITCPANISVNNDAGVCGAVVTFNAPIGIDNCPGASTSQTAGLPSGSTFPIGTTIQTFVVTDASGNTANCSFAVTVTDNQAPSITCPANISVNNDAGVCGAVVTFNAPIGSDNCPGSSTSQTAGLPSGSTFPIGTTTQTFVVTDASGNTANCSFTVTVTDNQNPSISCPANISVNNDAGVCGAVVTFNAPTGSDNCPGASTSQTAGLPSGSTFPIGTTIQTFVVTDASGNTANCSFMVTVTDNQAPSISCPANISVNNDAGVCGAVVTFNAPTGIDNCPGASTSQTAGLPSGSTFPIGTTTQTFVVTDASGNTANCSFTVTVTDNQNPSITCPANISVNNDAGVCGAVVTFNAPTGSDNCPGAITSQTAGLPSGSTFPIGTTTQTFVVTDASGNTANCSFTVTVTDNQNPSITCPANISVNNDAGVCGAVVTFNAPTGSDNCPGASTSQTAGLPSGSTFPIGTTIQTFVVTDASGNTANCSFTVTVIDNQAPSISCPANISVNNDAGVCGAVVTFNAPTGSDNCSGASTSQTAGLPSGSTFPIGTTTQTFVVTDASGNTANCSFTVTVTDNQAPSITCPANILVNNDAGVCGAVVTFNAPIGIDNCPGASTSQTAGLPSGSTFPIGTTIQTFVVTDASGNTANCSFTVTVTDNQAPTIACAANLNVNNTPGLCEATVLLTPPIVTDNCPNIITTGNAIHCDGVNDYLESSPLLLGTGNFTIEGWVKQSTLANFPVIFAQDQNGVGNPAFRLEVTNGSNTLLFAIADGVNSVAFNTSSSISVGTWVHVAVVRNGNVYTTFVNGIASGSLASAGSINQSNNSFNFRIGARRLNSSGAAGNPFAGAFDDFRVWNVARTGTQIQAAMNFELIGNESGLIRYYKFNQGAAGANNVGITTANATIGANATLHNFSLTGTLSNWVAGYVSNFIGTSVTNNAPSIFPVGSTNVVWTATDAYGNSSACTQIVTVTDIAKPTITCPGNISVNSNPGVCGAVVNYIAPIGTDNCSGSTTAQTLGLASGSTFPVGTTTNKFVVTDASGNQDSCSFTVTVTDNQAPSITCPANISVNNDAGVCGAVVTFVAPTGNDNCPGASTSQTAGLPSGATFPIGTTTNKFVVTDASGNKDSCSFTVTVTDTTKPTIACPATVSIANIQGQCGANATWAVPLSSDNCGVASVSSSHQPGDYFQLGTTSVTYTVTDIHGNSATCSFGVVVTDTQAPSIVCPQAITFSANSSGCNYTGSLIPPTASDNCTGPVTVSGPVPAGPYSVGTTTVTWTATDSTGNTSTCTQDIMVLQTTSSGSMSITSCGPYTWTTTTFFASGTYTKTFTNAIGCDSVHVMFLTVNNNTSGSSAASACGSYNWNGTVYTSSGQYTQTFMNANGCDSVHTLSLTIHPATSGTSSAAACYSYTWNSNTYTASGAYSQTFVNANGCDSVHTLQVTINGTTTGISQQQSCDSYTWNNTLYTTSGQYTHTYVNANGCDSVHTLDLTIIPSATGSSSATACDSYTWNTNTYTQSGNYTQTFMASNGCDSIHTLQLTINNSSSNTVAISAGGCYTWAMNGNTYTTSGTYTHTSLNQAGCVHTEMLQLTVSPQVVLQTRVILSGPYNAQTGLMHDSLRVNNYIPQTEPYSASPFFPAIGGAGNEQVDPTILAVSGPDAIVDWLYLELRSASNPATRIATKRALLQRDGDVVSHVDGASPVTFSGTPGGMYYISVKHRNHLGVMSAAAVYLAPCAGSSFDFTLPGVVYVNPVIANVPRRVFGSVHTLWSGDASVNKNTKYNGASNDKTPILNTVGMATPNNTVYGYREQDCNMDGKVRYNNTDNDRQEVLNNVGVSTPNAILFQHTPN
jgi:Fe-S cluster assembly iron-binding protein IscA